MDTKASHLKVGVRGRIAKAMTKGCIPRTLAVSTAELEAMKQEGAVSLKDDGWSDRVYGVRLEAE